MSDNQKIMTVLWMMGSLDNIKDEEMRELMLMVSLKIIASLSESDQRFINLELGRNNTNG